MFNINKKTALEGISVFVLIIASIAIHERFQPQILAGGGFGWDGIEYAKLWAAFSGETGPNSASFPFCNRIGAPFLASALGFDDPSTSFKILNLIFAGIFSYSIYLISRTSGLSYYYSVIAVALTIIPFFSPARFVPFYPVYTDPGFLALLSLSFLFLIKNRFGISCIFLFCSFIFREATLYIAPLFALFAIMLGEEKKGVLIKFLILLTAIIATKFAIQEYTGCAGSQFKTAIAYAHTRLSDPTKFMSYVAALSMTAAPVIYFNDIKQFSSTDKISLIGILASAALAFIGGSDSTRIFYSFFPMYFLIIVSTVRAKGVVFSIFCVFAYVVSNSFGRTIKEPLNYWPNRDESGLFWQFPDHARPEVGLVILAVWLFIFLIHAHISKRKH